MHIFQIGEDFMLNYLLIAGIAISLGFLLGKGTHRLKVTGIVGYLLTGVIIGPSVLGIVNLSNIEITVITNFALSFVAFIIGGELTANLFKKEGKKIGFIILSEALFAFFIVLFGVYLLSGDMLLAIILGAMAPASAPAGAIAVIHEYRAKGKLTDAILAVVGLDDGIAILIYAFAITSVGIFLTTGQFNITNVLLFPLKEIGGAVIIGGGVGVIFAYLLNKIHEREEIIAASFAGIFLVAGLSQIIGASLILASMILGVIVINLFPKDNKPVFDHLKSLSLPIYIIFFVIAGTNLHISVLLSVGIIGIIYIICRIIGKAGGSFLAAWAVKSEKKVRNYLGLSILSQAGVAIGLALLAANYLSSLGRPDIGTTIITIVTATTVVFEIIGPILARISITQVGEARKND